MKSDNKTIALKAAEARKLAVKIVHDAASGHPGGSLSCIDILTILYFDEMNVDPANPQDPDRDRFVMSKGHASPAVYPVLALRGYYPVEKLAEYRRIEYHMSGHVVMDVPGVDMSTGSLGQGVSVAVGMAMAGKMNKKDYRVYAILGEGEITEGQVWEAMLCANKYKLNNFCAFVDVNGLQIDGPNDEVMPTAPLAEKFAAFGANVIEINGHDIQEIKDALAAARACTDKYTIVLAKTVKGKGVSFMENQAGWHGKAPNDEQYAQAAAELDAVIKGLEG